VGQESIVPMTKLPPKVAPLDEVRRQVLRQPCTTTATQDCPGDVVSWERKILPLPVPNPRPPPPPPPPIKVVVSPPFRILLPPPQYDHVFMGQLTIKMLTSTEEMSRVCNKPPDTGTIGCSVHPYSRERCTIYLMEDSYLKQRGWNTGDLLRHEIAHCNGWPGDHPGWRYATDG